MTEEKPSIGEAGVPIWNIVPDKPSLNLKLIWILYLLLLFEGSLRKWGFPTYQRYLFFIRDPFLLLLYFQNLKFFPRIYTLPIGRLALAIFMFPVLSLPFHPMNHPDWVIFVLYGYRNYFLYIPLPFIMAYSLTKKNLEQFVRFTLLLSIPVAVLTFYQSVSPHNDPINQGVSADLENVFSSLVVSRGFIRTAGIFSSIEGHVYYIGTLAALVFSSFISRERLVSKYVFLASAVAFCSTLAVCGSRTAFSIVFFVLLISQVAGVLFLRKTMALKAFVAPLLIASLCFFLMFYFFSSQMSALSERVTVVAEETQDRYYWLEEVYTRVADDVNTTNMFINTSPLTGFGFGYGGNAGWMLNAPVIAEYPIGRHIIDLGPVFGLLYYLFRLWWLLFLGRGIVKTLKYTNDPFPLFYFSVLCIIFSWGQLTNQGSVLGYGWILSGFCLAYCVLPFRKPQIPINPPGT